MAEFVSDSEKTTRIYVRWSVDGQFIRKWSREPFADGEPVDAIGRAATDGEAMAWRLERVIGGGGPLTLSDKAVLREAISTLSADAIRQGGGCLRDEIRSEIINTPETADFMAGVPLEATHQRDRWGVDHDAGKGPLDWFWLIGYLAQKAADAAMRGDSEKAKHHTISTAAALGNWHAALTGADNRMRPGIATPASHASDGGEGA